MNSFLIFNIWFSLGCGIGYGYLHRIPAQPAASPAHPTPSAAAPSVPSPEEKPPVNQPAHGFTEVKLTFHFPCYIDHKKVKLSKEII